MDKQHNYKPVAEFIANIKSGEEKQTQAWKAIANEFYELKSTYGFQSDEAKEVITAIGYSKSKVSKLAANNLGVIYFEGNPKTIAYFSEYYFSNVLKRLN